MHHELTLYFFSPTGGTAKVADIVCGALAASVQKIDLADKTLTDLATPATDLIVVAAPVFVGRIRPSVWINCAPCGERANAP